ncbi:MAG: DUF4363 family protein [Candidatus Fimadaptatus sp.]
MKLTIATICAIIALTAALCVYTTATLNDSTACLQELTAQLQTSADTGDADGCREAAQALWAEWQERFARLASLIPHEDLDKVSVAITGIWQRARLGETRELSPDIGILGEHLDHLVHKEEFRWENLL